MVFSWRRLCKIQKILCKIVQNYDPFPRRKSHLWMKKKSNIRIEVSSSTYLDFMQAYEYLFPTKFRDIEHT